MDKEQVVEIVQKYYDVIKNLFNIKRVVLFGSYSNGVPREWSDIDVAIFLDEKPNDLIGAESLLYKLRRNIDSRIEPIIIYDENDPSGFAAQVLNNGIIITQAN